MTPLARYFADQLCMGPTKRDRQFRPIAAAAREAITDTQFFDVSELWPLVMGDGDTLFDHNGNYYHDTANQLLTDRLFLPAPRTWLEFHFPQMPDWPTALLLEEDGGGVSISQFSRAKANFHGSVPFKLGLWCNGEYFTNDGWFERWMEDVRGGNETPWPDSSLGMLLGYRFLILVNAPQIIGRRTFKPNRSLENRLKRRANWGHFPLHAWHEIKLEVNKPPEIDDGEPHQAVLTGRRALHFVRKHIRIKQGRLEYVSAHWRGDASIGIKRARYKAVA